MALATADKLLGLSGSGVTKSMQIVVTSFDQVRQVPAPNSSLCAVTQRFMIIAALAGDTEPCYALCDLSCVQQGTWK